MNVPVYTFEGKEDHKIELRPEVFDGKVNTALLHQVVKAYQAAKRAGCASTKTRGEVRGGGKKPWRQKGTGRARVGSIRNPLWRGGGTVFGPHPRDFRYTLPKKLKRLALKSALNAKLKDNQLFIVDNIELQKPKTKLFVQGLEKFLVNAATETRGQISEAVPKAKKRKKAAKAQKKDTKKIPSSMLVLERQSEHLLRASRNVQRIKVVDTNNFNTLDILLHQNLIIAEKGLEGIYNRISAS